MATIFQVSILVLSLLCCIPFSHGGPATDFTDIERYIDPQNTYRAEVNVPDLKWNSTLAEIASDVAYRLNDLAGCRPVPSTHYVSVNGTKLYVGINSYVDCLNPSATADIAARSWFMQKTNYDYSSNSCIGNTTCQAYTQVVWKNSTDIGCSSPGNIQCGPSECSPHVALDLLFVCVYYPPGNIPGERPY